MQLIKNILKVIIPLILAILLISYVLKDVNPAELLARLEHVNYWWVSVAIFISLISHLIRGVRWHMMLEPLGYKPSPFNLFSAVMIGYFSNVFLPRAGEFVRCVALHRSDKVPVNAAFGTVIAERAIDFISLLLLMGLSLSLEFERFYGFLSNLVFQQKPDSALKIFIGNHYPYLLILVSIVLLLVFFKRKTILNSTLFIKILSFLKGIWEGLTSIKNIQNKKAYIFQTMLIWLCYFLMTYTMFFTLTPTASLSLEAGLVILIVGGLGMSAPVSGGIGPFHLMVSAALTLLYGISNNDGIAYAFVIHTSQMIMVIVIGGILGLINFLKYRNLTNP
jgi:hypothetical protein